MSKPAKQIADAVDFAVESMHLDRCQAHHFGPWMIEPEWFKSAVDAVNRGVWKAQGPTTEPADNQSPPYRVVNGTAVIPISGPMMKARSKFGGTSTVDARTQIRKAVNDAGVTSIMLHIDSPGGTVAGTDALAGDVAAANAKLVGGVHAHIEDMGASAAYYVASQARSITASKGSLIGSLGVRMMIVDSSGAAEKEGLKVHDISSGEFKGAGTPGVPITGRQLEYFKGIVDAGNAHFKAAVMSGRDFTQEQADALFDGKVHDAEKAQQLGLIDEVSTLDSAMAAIQQETKRMNAESFKTYAAEHPEAVAGYIEQGKKLGYADARTDLRALCEAVPGKPLLAIESFLAGSSVEQAKATATAVDTAVADKDKEIKAKDDEIAKLKAAATAPGGAAPLNLAPDKTTEGKTETDLKSVADPEAFAKQEWTEMSADARAAFINESVFIKARTREIRKAQQA